MNTPHAAPRVVSLAESARNCLFTISKIEGGQQFVKKLENLGIKEGGTMTVLNKHVLKGPIVVKVKNTQVALGYMMAKKIWGTVKTENGK